MVGGSGLYADSILYGIDRFPKVKTDIKKQIISLFKNEGIKRLNSMLEKYDPEYYNIVDKNNSRRIIEALEICLSTGKPFTSFLKKKRKNSFFESKILLMNPERKELYKKINTRVNKMISIGLEKKQKNFINIKIYILYKLLATVSFSTILKENTITKIQSTK